MSLPMRGSDGGSFDRLSDQAEFLLRTKRYSLAIEYATKALAILPDDPRPYVQIAYAKVRMRDSDASQWAQKAIAIEPDNAKWHAALSEIYGIQGKWNQALAQMQKAVTLAPGDSRFQSGMGQCLIHVGKSKEAIPYLKKSLQLNPQDPYTHSTMSTALQKTGDLKGSQEHLEKALQLAPENPNLHTLLGWSLRKRRKSKEAKDVFDEALRLDPTQTSAKLGIGTRVRSKFFLADILLRAALSNPGGKRLLALRLFLALFLLYETSTLLHGLYLWPVWGIELVLLFTYYRIGHRFLRFLARRRNMDVV